MSRECVGVAALICFVLLSSVPALAEDETDVIRVGVRADAEPFSYRASRYDELKILKGYGGYMIEICRRVLKQMTASGPLRGAVDKPVELSSGDRFRALDRSPKIEKQYHVDMLCGPDSITLARLEKFNASHPVFLSGITFLRVPELPTSTWCKPVIGLVENTTAQRVGLTLLARGGELVRFDKALDAWLAATPDNSPANNSEGNDKRKVEDLIQALSKMTATLNGQVSATKVPSRDNPSSIVNNECEDGYTDGPVKLYKNHELGIKAFCEREVLYYMGDFDILNRKVSDRKGCKYLARRETLTRESYGMYFRRPRQSDPDRGRKDAVLYAEFNNVLLKKMESEDILGYEFRREFTSAEPSRDLAEFFESFRYATH